MRRLFLLAALLMVALGSIAETALSTPQGTVTGNGAWSYFGDPRAVYANGTTFVGWVTSNGYVQVASLKGSVQHTRTLDYIGQDDHSNPSLYIRPSGQIVAFWAPHGAGPTSKRGKMFYRLSTHHYDVRSWGPIHQMPANTAPAPGNGDRGFSYPNPVKMSYGQTWVFWRGGSWWPTVSITTDFFHWKRPRNVVTSIPGKRPYTKYAADGENVFMAFSRSHPGSMTTGIYFLRISKSGKIFRSNGNQVGSLDNPPSYTNATPLYHYTPSRGRAWPLDVAVDPDHHPVVIYQRRDSTLGDVYRYDWYDGSKWHDRLLATAGRSPLHPSFYQGGATLDHEDPTIAYVSRRPAKDKPYEIQIYTTADHGKTWTTLDVTKHSSRNEWRPVSPWGHPGMQVFWWRGRYGNFRDYDTKILHDLKRRALLRARAHK